LKLSIVFVALLAVCFSLSAQSPRSSVAIFFPLVTGTGSSRSDNAYITTMLTNEMKTRNCIVAGSLHEAGYSLYGMLAEYHEEWLYLLDYSFSNTQNKPDAVTTHTFNSLLQNSPEQLYVLQLILKNEKSNEVILLQNVLYHSMDDVYNFFPILVSNIFFGINGKQVNTRNRSGALSDKSSKPVNAQDDSDADWFNKRLYLGFSGFWSPRVYYGAEQSALFVNFGGGVSVEASLLKFLSFGTGLELVPDWVWATDNENDNYRNLMLEIPFSLKFVIKVSHYLIAPYGGVHINIPLYDTTVPTRSSWMVGLDYGVKAGPGIIFVEPRFSRDIDYSHINADWNVTAPSYRRIITHIGVGYKFGFF